MKKFLLSSVLIFALVLTGCTKDPCECNNEERQKDFEKNIECENRLDEFIGSLEKEKGYDYGGFSSFYSPITESCIFKYSYDKSTPKKDPQYMVYYVLADTKTKASYEESIVVFQDEREIHSCLYRYDFPKASGFNGKFCDIDLEVEYLLSNKTWCICSMSGDIIKKNNTYCENKNEKWSDKRMLNQKKYNHETGLLYSPILNRCLKWEKYDYWPDAVTVKYDGMTGMRTEYKVGSPLGLPTYYINEDHGRGYYNFSGDYNMGGSFIPTIDVMKNSDLSAEEYFFKEIDYLKSNPTEVKIFRDVMRYRGDWCKYFDRCDDWIDSWS